MIIKVCGLREPENIAQVAAIQGIDLIGLIFYAPSPRYLESAATATFVPSLTDKKTVGVFVNEETEVIVSKCGEYHLDYIQLHGNETPEYIRLLSQRLPSFVKMIKAFSIRSADDLEFTSGYEGLCEYFLFDTPSAGYGGSGHSFDWSVIQHYKGLTPFLLSGGIGPDSIAPLADFQHQMLAGLDLNSRFEIRPGLKNVPLLTEFVQNIKITRL